MSHVVKWINLTIGNFFTRLCIYMEHLIGVYLIDAILSPSPGLPNQALKCILTVLSSNSCVFSSSFSNQLILSGPLLRAEFFCPFY